MFKSLKLWLFTVTLSLICTLGICDVYADVTAVTCSDPYDINPSVYDDYTVWGDNSIHDSNSWKFNSGGRIVYCSEKGVPIDSSGGSYVSYQSLDDASNNLMARVLAYGYIGNNDENCSVARIGTQTVVHMAAKEIETGNTAWRNLTVSQISAMYSGSYKDSIASYAYNLMQQVFTHGTVPSFTKATSSEAASDSSRIELKYNEEARNFSNVLTNTNKETVLSTWTVKSVPSKVTAATSGENLTITSKDDSVSTPVSLSKTYKSGSTVYRRVVGTSQPTVYATPPTSTEKVVYVGYKYEEIGKGIVKIHKIDKYTGANMKGATFGIFQDDECTKKAVDYLGNELSDKKTNKNGIVSWDNLYYPLKAGESRTYYVKETQTIKGYAFDNDELDKLGAKNACIPVKITADYIEDENGSATTEINKNEEFEQAIYNIPYGNITILKQDEETGKVVEGVEFELVKNNSKKDPAIDINGNIVKNVVTDERGIAEFENIPYGDYILREVKANDWYKVLEKPIEFTLNKDNDALKYVDQGTEAVPEENEPMIPLEKYKLGDPTDDGKINNDDIAVIDNIIAEAIEETPLQFYASDVNKDNVVDATDKELMQKYIDGDNTAIPNALTEEDIPGQVQKRVTLSITNVPIDMKVSKQSITNEKELKGATIVIKNAKGEVFIKYVSTTKPKEFYIPIGDYTLVETVAPKGYQTLKTEVKFRVLSDGNIKLLSAKSNMYELVKSKEDNDTDLDHLKIYNNLEKISVPNTGSVIAISTLIGGILLICGGSYVIYRRYKTN